MNAVFSMLIKGGGGLLRESIEAYIGGVVARRAVKYAVRAAIVYTLVGLLGLAALAFLYVTLYMLLAARLDDWAAAAILCGVNLLLIALILVGRRLARPRPVRGGIGPARGILDSFGEGRPAVDRESLEAGIALGMQVGERLRKAAPEIALAAGIVGLIIGVRPEILTLFSRRAGKSKPRD